MKAIGKRLPFFGDHVSSEELVRACLENIEHCEEQVRAWVVIDRDGALAQAKRCDEETQSGRGGGFVHGMPLGIKDIVDVAGFPTRAGSPMLEGAAVAETDSPLVANLRRQGAVILGKTVTTEFACFDPPVTRNPHHLEHTPGGSSSGSAAAVASGMCLAAVGSQTGGSITRPASFCGVVGFKPAIHDLSVRGVIPISARLDHPGPLARSVTDAFRVWQAMKLQPASTVPAAVPQLRLTAMERFFFGSRCDADVGRATRAVLARLTRAEPAVAFADPPVDFEQVLVHHRCIMAVDCASHHRQTYGLAEANYGPHVWSLIQAGLAASDGDYQSAIDFQASFRQGMLDWLQDRVAVMPSTVSVAPGIQTTGDPAFNAPWSLAGLPTLSVPIGTVAGMPIGLQLVGRDAEQVFASGLTIESRLAEPTP